MSDWKKNTVHTLRVEGYTAEGAGVARLEGRAVFVPHTVRGELWEVLLVKTHPGYAWGKGLRLLGPSSLRLEPDCPYAGRCGGCQFRHMDYQEELWAKGQRVQDTLRRLGGVEAEIPPVLGAAEVCRYRNKVQFPVADGPDGPAVGFYRARSHDVVDVEDCLLQPASAGTLRQALKEWMEEFSVPPYREETGAGLIRHLCLRTNHRGQVLCCVVARQDALPEEASLVARLRRAEEGLAGVLLNVNPRDTNVILGDTYRTLWGQDSLDEELCGLTFRLSMPSFFQVNRAQTEVLYRTAVEFAGLTGTQGVLDLYCGIGSISLCLAQKAARVLGAEVVPQAVADARENARRNGISHAEFFCGDAGAVAERLAASGFRPQVVCVDPPRKGLEASVPGIVAGLEPERVVYVSCDPATLARDVARFRETGYEFVRAQPVDLFPRTAHVECVVLLRRKA